MFVSNHGRAQRHGLAPQEREFDLGIFAGRDPHRRVERHPKRSNIGIVEIQGSDRRLPIDRNFDFTRAGHPLGIDLIDLRGLYPDSIRYLNAPTHPRRHDGEFRIWPYGYLQLIFGHQIQRDRGRDIVVHPARSLHPGNGLQINMQECPGP